MFQFISSPHHDLLPTITLLPPSNTISQIISAPDYCVCFIPTSVMHIAISDVSYCSSLYLYCILCLLPTTIQITDRTSVPSSISAPHHASVANYVWCKVYYLHHQYEYQLSVLTLLGRLLFPCNVLFITVCCWIIEENQQWTIKGGNNKDSCCIIKM